MPSGMIKISEKYYNMSISAPFIQFCKEENTITNESIIWNGQQKPAL